MRHQGPVGGGYCTRIDPDRVRPGTTAPGGAMGTPLTSRPPSGAPMGGGRGARPAGRRDRPRRGSVTPKGDAVGRSLGDFSRRTSRSYVYMTSRRKCSRNEAHEGTTGGPEQFRDVGRLVYETPNGSSDWARFSRFRRLETSHTRGRSVVTNNIVICIISDR